jgi:ketosteroid isomerase-like protein
MSAPMSTQDNKTLVMEGYRLFQQGAIPELLQRYHEDAVWVQPETMHIPFGGTYRTRAGIAQLFTKLADAVDAIRFEPEQVIGEGDKVVVTGQATWRVKHNGAIYESPWAHVFSLRDGKVAELHAYFDSGAGERAFSALPGTRTAGADATMRQ